MRRPLADAKVPEWRRYADHLEAQLADRAHDPSTSLWGIPIIEDARMPAGQAELRWKGETVARVVGLNFFGIERLPKDFQDEAILRRAAPDADQIFRAYHKARLDYLNPDEICIHLVTNEGDENE